MTDLDGSEMGDDYWRAFLDHVLPPTQVVYEEGREQAAILLRDDAERFDRREIVPSYIDLAPLGELNVAAGYTCPPLRRAGRFPRGAYLFCHARRTPEGQERLVAVALELAWTYHERRGFIIDAEVLDPTAGAFASEAAPVGTDCLDFEVAFTDRLRFYAGQPDASDDTRFIVGYELNGTSGSIEGRLLMPATRERVDAWEPHAVDMAIATGPLSDQPLER